MEDKYTENIAKIKVLIKEIYDERKKTPKFIPGKSRVHYSGPIFDEHEINAVIENITAGIWLAEGKATSEFERGFSGFIGSRETVVVNSGSTALMIIFATLMLKDVEDHLNVGDEVITSALTFPTTLNSILFNRLTPVFVDVDKETYNMDPVLIEKMISKKTKAILITHHLGNPCDMDRIMEIAKAHDLFVIEDCCDAHGAKYKGKRLGSFGDMAAFSFYVAHAMTMGEGGAVVVNDYKFAPLVRSLKTCGRACSCTYCEFSLNPDFQCSLRFNSKIKDFESYDKRTLYPYIGFKSKVLDLQCAFGLEQLKRIEGFVKKRQENFDHIINGLKKYKDFLVFPKVLDGCDPSWFGIPLSLKEGTKFKRDELTKFLEKNNIETRPLLGGNLLKQPAYKDLTYRSSPLPFTDFHHDNSFYIGCYPGITSDMIDFVLETFEKFFDGIEKD